MHRLAPVLHVLGLALGLGGRQLLRAELPGPIKVSKLTPRLFGAPEGGRW